MRLLFSTFSLLVTLGFVSASHAQTTNLSPQELSKKIMQEGYIALESSLGRSNTATSLYATQQALETAYQCSKRLNNDHRTKRKLCHNLNQDISAIGYEFSNGEKLCAAIDVKGQGNPKAIVTSDSRYGSVTFENDVISMVIPTRRSSREFFYDLSTDQAHSILGDTLRTDFSECWDDE